MLERIKDNTSYLFGIACFAIAVTVFAAPDAAAYDPSCGTGPGLSQCSWGPPQGNYSGWAAVGRALGEMLFNSQNGDSGNQATSASPAAQLNNEGVRCQRSGNLQCAARYYEQALRFDPSNAVIRGNLAGAKGHLLNDEGIRLFDAKKYSEAISTFQNAIAFLPNDPHIRANFFKAQAFLAESLKNYEQAMAYFKQALQYTPQDRSTLGNIAYVQAELAAKQGNSEQVISYFKQALQYWPGDKGVSMRIAAWEAYIAETKGDYVGAAAKIREAMRYEPNSKDLALRLSRYEALVAQASAGRLTEGTKAKDALIASPRSGDQTWAQQQQDDAIAAENSAAQWHAAIERDQHRAQGQIDRLAAAPKPATPEAPPVESIVTSASAALSNDQGCLGGTPALNSPCVPAPNLGQPVKEKGVDNPNPSGQADIAKKEGKTATESKNDEEAKKLTGRQFDTAPTEQGAPLPVLATATRDSYIQKSVFATVRSDADWQLLKKTPAGRALIEKADDQLRAIATAEVAVRNANQSGVQADMDAAYANLRKLQDTLQKDVSSFQSDATKIIEVARTRSPEQVTTTVILEGDKNAASNNPVAPTAEQTAGPTAAQ